MSSFDNENPFLSVIRVWAALAWADGVIADSEAAAIRELVGNALLNERERQTALGWLENKVELDLSNLQGLRADARQGLYRSAVQMAGVDEEFADEEKSLLARLREMLELDADAADRIEKDVMGSRS